MRSKPLLWLTLALLPVIAVPVLGQPRPVGDEFRVNANTANQAAQSGRRVQRLRLFAGRLGERPDRPARPFLRPRRLARGLRRARPGGEPDAPRACPPAASEVIRKEPAVAFLPSGEFLLAWTEERDKVSIDLFTRHRDVLDRDVYVQKFSAAGAPQGTAGPPRTPPPPASRATPRSSSATAPTSWCVWQSDDRTASKLGDGIFGRLVRSSTVQATSNELKLSSVPGFAANAADRRGRQRRLRGRLGSRGRRLAGRLRAPVRPLGLAARRRIPRQHHGRRPPAPAGHHRRSQHRRLPGGLAGPGGHHLRRPRLRPVPGRRRQLRRSARSASARASRKAQISPSVARSPAATSW